MAKQERKAVKKYLEDQARKEATSAARQKANATPPKSARKDAPWSKNNNSNNKEGQGAGSRDAKTAAASYSAQRAPPKRPNAFQQVSLTTRLFSVDDVRDMTFEGGYTDDVPFLGLPEIAVFGRSNVGKSSLLNCLAGASSNRVAVVSKTPGRTQQINLFKVHDSSGPVAVVVDLPGYGYAKLPKALQSDIGSQVRALCLTQMTPQRTPLPHTSPGPNPHQTTLATPDNKMVG
jgi:ATPase subunit of ABC transporter with duplicated ATPase domains